MTINSLIFTVTMNVLLYNERFDIDIKVTPEPDVDGQIVTYTWDFAEHVEDCSKDLLTPEKMEYIDKEVQNHLFRNEYIVL